MELVSTRRRPNVALLGLLPLVRARRQRRAAAAAAAPAAGAAAAAPAAKEGVAIGIDFGTSNSAVAVQLPDGNFVAVTPPGMHPGKPTMPTAVAYNAAGKLLVGVDALRVKPGPDQVVFRSFKRLIGRTYADTYAIGLNPNVMGADPAGRKDELVRLLLPGKLGVLMPEDLAAVVIRALMQCAEAFIGQKVTRCVLGVPARFNRLQHKLMEYAAQLAGIETVRLVAEPELAVRAYGFKVRPGGIKVRGASFKPPTLLEQRAPAASDDEDMPQPDMRRVLVADLGGGTFDVCIVRNIVQWDEIHILFTAGDERLGGDDFDNDVYTWATKSLRDHIEHLRRGPLTKMQKLQLRVKSRHAKERLSSAEKTELEFAGAKLQISRGDLNVIVRRTLGRMLDTIRQAAMGAGCALPNHTFAQRVFDRAEKERRRKRPKKKLPNKEDGDESIDVLRNRLGVHEPDNKKKDDVVDEVLCVGAASWMPAVRELLELVTGVKATVSLVEPETAVAVGGAVLASIMDAKTSDVQIFSAWRHAWTTHLLSHPRIMEKLKQEKEAKAKAEAESAAMRAQQEVSP